MYDSTFLIKMVQARMPFGKYEGRFITDLPMYYLEWFQREGFPNGDLGQYLSTMYEVKVNGIENVLDPIKAEFRRKRCP
ncbi:MAG: DUF3820 family protein [Balneolales bacterium]|nr:DUF3820 family protein [Balneolales bacterium]